MAPKKQPSRLFDLSVKKTLCTINSACYLIEKSYPENKYAECEKEALALKRFMMSSMPVRLFDIICSARTSQQYRGDPRIQLTVLTHPNLTIFRKCDVDNSIPQHFWLDTLATFNQLRVLDLKFICSDEILAVIGDNCPLLEDINIVSRVDVCKSLFNASVLIRNVSDEGLRSVAKLQHLKILTMDPPRNERLHKIGRCVTQTGVITLICQIPELEELRIDTCDVGTTLISSKAEIGPLRLQKINCHFASGDGIKKLLKICPHLKEMSVTHISEDDKDTIMHEISAADANLTRLDLSFFTFTVALHDMLFIKGKYLTHFSLWEIELSLTFENIICIGSLCPHLKTLCIGTQSPSLVVPSGFIKEGPIFKKLRKLTLGNGNFCMDSLLNFFLNCTIDLEELVLKYQTKIDMNQCLRKLMREGRLFCLTSLWCDCTIEISKDTAIEIIVLCKDLKTLTMDFGANLTDFELLVEAYNMDLKIGSY